MCAEFIFCAEHIFFPKICETFCEDVFYFYWHVICCVSSAADVGYESEDEEADYTKMDLVSLVKMLYRVYLIVYSCFCTRIELFCVYFILNQD